MGSYADLQSILDQITKYDGKDAWKQGLTEQQIRDVVGWQNASKLPDLSAWTDPVTGVRYDNREANTANRPEVPDIDLDRLRNIHQRLFGTDKAPLANPSAAHAAPGAPPGAGPLPTPTGILAPPIPNPDPKQQGESADAARALEQKLKDKVSASAAADRNLAEAVLTAQSTTADGWKALNKIQDEIEQRVKNQVGLDSPSGAAEFHQFLLAKQKEIMKLITDAKMDANSAVKVLSALQYAGEPTKDATNDSNNENNKPEKDNNSDNNAPGAPPANNSGAETVTPPADTGAGDPLTDLLSDPSLADPSMLGSDLGATSATPQIPMPTMPSIPSLGSGGGIPGLGSGSSPGSALSDLLKPDTSDKKDDPLTSLLDDPLLDGADEKQDPENPDAPKDENPEGKDDKPENNDKPVPGAPVPGQLAPPTAPGSGPTEVVLPNGDKVMAPNPAYAEVTKDIAAGTPPAEAFRKHGISILPPGAAVTNPMDPSKITMGAVGQYTDHQIYAVTKDLAVINGQIRPISEAQGSPGFLGWIPPPEIPDAPQRPPVAPAAAITPAAAPPTLSTPTPPAATSLLTPTKN